MSTACNPAAGLPGGVRKGIVIPAVGEGAAAIKRHNRNRTMATTTTLGPQQNNVVANACNPKCGEMESAANSEV